MLSAALIKSAHSQIVGILMNLLIVILEPGGWFAVWTGLEKIFFSDNEKKQEMVFYEKMSNIQIDFYSY